MKPFTMPIIEVVAFRCEDVVTFTFSIPSVDDEGYNNTVVKP